MILNSYAVLALFVALVSVLGAIVVVTSVRAIRRGAPGEDDADSARDSRTTSLFLLAFTLLGASVASWPLLYLLLQKLVPEWEGVMCIQGVTRVGTGSEGAAGLLPALVQALEITKPALVFATGSWLVVHLANRRTRTAPLAGRALAILLVVGSIATVDACAELAYVAIPKKERFLADGCCTTPTAAMLGSAASEGRTPLGLPGTRRGWVVGTFYALAGAVVLGARALSKAPPARGGPAAEARADDGAGRRGGFAWLGVGVVASVPAAVVFLSEVAAPAFLHLPAHRCAYCLLSDSPWGVVTAALLATGVFSTGWAVVAHALARTPETAATLPTQRRRLLRVGALGYVGALAAVTIGLVLA